MVLNQKTHMAKIESLLLLLAWTLLPVTGHATKFMTLKVVDQEFLMVQFRDGEVRYRDNGCGSSAFLGHCFAQGDDTLRVFGTRLNPSVAMATHDWAISSPDDSSLNGLHPVAVSRKAKPMNTDHTLTSELDHWFFLRLPPP